MNIDLTGADHFLVSVASLAIMGCAPIVTYWLKSHLHAATGSALSTDLDNAVRAGARLAIDSLASVADHNRTIELHNSAVAMGVQYALGAAPSAVKALGITPDHVAAMVSGEVAKALGVRPQPKQTTPPPAAPADQQKAS